MCGNQKVPNTYSKYNFYQETEWKIIGIYNAQSTLQTDIAVIRNLLRNNIRRQGMPK